MTHVIKADGRRASEHFDRSKLHASITAAGHSVTLPYGTVHDTAEHVCRVVERWVADKAEITSADIRRIAARTLETVSPEAAYLYKHEDMIV